MAVKTVIAVGGSTGAQGGAPCRAIVDHPHGAYAWRAITRDRSADNGGNST